MSEQEVWWETDFRKKEQEKRKNRNPFEGIVHIQQADVDNFVTVIRTYRKKYDNHLKIYSSCEKPSQLRTSIQTMIKIQEQFWNTEEKLFIFNLKKL